LRFLVLLNLVMFLIIFLLVLLPVFLTKFKITNSTFVLIPFKDMGEWKACFTAPSVLAVIFVLSLSQGAMLCCRNKCPHHLQCLMTAQVYFSPTIHLITVVFTVEPKLMQ
jgi:hypothetical protein